MCEPERTFKRFGVQDGARWDLTEVVDEHSEHIEKVEAALEGALLMVERLLRLCEAHAQRLDWHKDYINAHGERLSAIEDKLGLEVYAVAPPEGD